MDRIDIQRRVALLFGAVALLGACGDSGTTTPPKFAPNPSPPPPGGGPPFAETFTSGLVHPWGMAFLPDASILVTERDGNMRLVSADGKTVSAPLTGLPTVYASGQGGLLDVAIDPDFDFGTTPWVYWTYAEGDVNLSGTAVARGKLDAASNALTDVQVIFQQLPKVTGDGHYGSRLVFAADKTLFVTLGERQTDDPTIPSVLYNAQNPANHLGKVVRINRDGTVPANNPFVNVAGYLPEIYSLGHRNPQGATWRPTSATSGELWLNEHGPQGGDEVNLVLAGKNYGWPLYSYGCPYGATAGSGCEIGGGTHLAPYVEPLAKWVPTSIAPSGMMFYTGSGFPEWQNSLFVGALAGQALWRLPLVGSAVNGQVELFTDLNERIRDVRQGPDGWIYLLTDSANGRIVRIRR